MKKIILYIAFLVVGKFSFAQADTSLLYIKYPDLPPFTITKVPDSSKFTKVQLQKKKAVIIMLFSPDCEHCQIEVKEFIQNINLFKNVQLVLISHLDYRFLKTFYKDYNIAKYKNITVGKETSYFLGNFYKVKFLPAIFLYNKNGQFVKAFDGSVPVTLIAKSL